MKDILIVIAIAFGLAMDCLAVSLCIGSSPFPKNIRSIFRVSFHFGLFQGGMTLLGWLLGSTVVKLIAQFDHWLALLFLAWVGGRMIYEGIAQNEDQTKENCEDPTRGSTLVMLSVATSIDALGVGLSLALLKVNVTYASLIIGMVSLLLSIGGLLSGKQLGARFGKNVEIFGGVLLIFIGLRIVATHLLV